MRKIKVRMYDLIKNEMTIPGMIHNGYYSDNPNFVYMERTELYDKNNTPIYEGDILYIDLGNQAFKSTVVYNNGCFKIEFPPLYYHGGAKTDNLEHWAEYSKVISNIYEDKNKGED